MQATSRAVHAIHLKPPDFFEKARAEMGGRRYWLDDIKQQIDVCSPPAELKLTTLTDGEMLEEDARLLAVK